MAKFMLIQYLAKLIKKGGDLENGEVCNILPAIKVKFEITITEIVQKDLSLKK